MAFPEPVLITVPAAARPSCARCRPFSPPSSEAAFELRLVPHLIILRTGNAFSVLTAPAARLLRSFGYCVLLLQLATQPRTPRFRVSWPACLHGKVAGVSTRSPMQK